MSLPSLDFENRVSFEYLLCKVPICFIDYFMSEDLWFNTMDMATFLLLVIDYIL